MKSVKDRLFVFAAPVVLLLVVGTAVFFLYRARVASKGPQDSPAKQSSQVVLPGGEISFTVPVEAQHMIPVGSPVDGVIEKMDVELGGELLEGQLIARVKNTSLETNRDQAIEEADLAQTRVDNLERSLIAARLEASRATADAVRAKGEYESARKVADVEQYRFSKGAQSKLVAQKAAKAFENARQEFDSLTALAKQADERVSAMVKDLDNARLALSEKNKVLEEAKADLAAADIVSPADGVLIGARAKQGDEVKAATTDLFHIGFDLHELAVTVEPDPSVMARLKQGLPALVTILDYSSDAIDAEIASVEETKVVIHFISPDPSVKPGTNAVVKIRVP